MLESAKNTEMKTLHTDKWFYICKLVITPTNSVN